MITKSPKNPKTYTRQLLFTNSARTGWRHLLRYLNIKIPNKILLPAYIGITQREGSGIIDPVEETNTPFIFYRLNKKLTIDITDFEYKIINNEIRLALIIHYFGFFQSNIKSIRKICDDNDVLLVEDCAHVFYNSDESYTLGTDGDFSFYSLHKYLAVNSGGILKINNSRFELPKIPDKEKCSSGVLEQLLITNFKQIAIKRRHNYCYLLEKLQNIEGIETMYPNIESLIIPHNFPIIVKKNRREELYFKLLEKGIPTIALYYRLIDAITKDKYPVSHYVSSSILNLPVHQEIEIDDLDILINELMEF